jgi:hypothetical protein
LVSIEPCRCSADASANLVIALAIRRPAASPAATPPASYDEAVRANRRVRELLARSPAPVPIDVPDRFRMLLAPGFRDVNRCVVLRALARGIGRATYDDRTGVEASTNSTHVEDYLPRGDPARQPLPLAHTALACARLLAEALRAFSSRPFRIIFNVNEGEYITSVIRFHTIRIKRTWLGRDIEAYTQEGVLELDTTDDPDMFTSAWWSPERVNARA